MSVREGAFEELKSLVDVGGGTGTVAKAIAKAFPQLDALCLISHMWWPVVAAHVPPPLSDWVDLIIGLIKQKFSLKILLRKFSSTVV
ncbi:hypothetical protein GH714_008035 [Hevea brasiliensis]|uniref:O-methyltransferase C-terminal domain-containing protein n=1 Tax=Hevea brasiliensis TaxID=3981 RepID=A0A6A6K419_HEVBR|nr:hypothetical protein GH714_008035 [Hevea brasiliensis]